MTQLNEEHLEVIDKNKIERYRGQKLTRMEDRIKDLEKSLGRVHTILGRYQMKEGNND